MVNRLNDWKIIFRVLMVASILIYFRFKLHWIELWMLLMQSELVWLLIASFLLGVSFLLASIRWLLLVKVQEIFVNLKVATDIDPQPHRLFP